MIGVFYTSNTVTDTYIDTVSLQLFNSGDNGTVTRYRYHYISRTEQNEGEIKNGSK